MLTKDDFAKITTIVQSETRKIVKEETLQIVQSETRKIVQEEIQKEIKPVHKNLRRIEKKLNFSIKFLDSDFSPRLKRIETIMNLPPLPFKN